MRRRYLLAVLAMVALAGAGLWAWLAPPSAECTAKPGEPDQYLVRICRYLRANEIDVTIRDNADRQQPFNLRVPGGVQTVGAPEARIMLF